MLSIVLYDCPHIKKISIENSAVAIGEQFQVTITAGSSHPEDWQWDSEHTFQYKYGVTNFLQSPVVSKNIFDQENYPEI